MYSGNGRPPSRVAHILESAEFLRTDLHGLTFERFSRNRALVLAALYALQVAGEASITIPDEIKDARPGIPWRDMRAMRNIIAHQYFRVNLELVWDAIQNVFLPLEQEFRDLLNSLSQDD